MKLIKLLLLFAISGSAFAGGFQINTQSIKGIGLSGAFTALCSDASSAFFNPGAMGFLEKKTSITLGDAVIMPHTSYLSPYSGNVNMENQSFFPFQVYGTFKLKKLSVGLSINNPYGLGTKWNDTWEGRYISQEVLLKTIYFQPTVSYNITDNIGIGAGLVFANGTAEIRKAAQNTGTGDVLAQLKGDGTGFGFNIGALFKLGKNSRIGVDYRSAVQVDLNNGDASFTNIPGSLTDKIPASTTFNSGVKFPYTISLGFSQKTSEKFLFTADFNYTGWSTFDSLNFLFPDYPELDSRNARNYKNVIAVRTGVQYSMKEKLQLRAGFAYDQSPVKDGYVSPDLPDADKVIFSLGCSYQFSSKFGVDASYSFESMSERKGEYAAQGFSGTYKTNVYIVGVGLNYGF